MGQNFPKIRVRGTVYHYRRRVPCKLVPIMGQTEIIRSLETSSAREARRRASIMCVETDRVFQQMSMSLAQEQVTAIVRRLKSESFWDAPTREEILTRYADGDRWTLDRLFTLGEPQISALSEEDRSRVAMHLRRLLEGVEQHLMAKRTELAEVRAENAEAGALISALDAEEQVVRVVDAFEGRLKAATPAAATAAVPAKGSPLFSERMEDFLRYKSTPGDDGKAYSNQTLSQTRVTFRLWTELVGDKPLRSYTREEVGRFREQLLQMPATHGKNGKVISAGEAISLRQRDAVAAKTMSQKTAKRHFSALSQYWKWLRVRGLVDDIIFGGFEFPGAKTSKRRRDDWSPSDLRRLFEYEPWYGAGCDRNSAFFWLPLISLHSGMRVEEIARLRPDADIDVIDGVPVFRIQPHSDGWEPKSEAGERVVPIHSVLIKMGFLRFVEARRAARSKRLFTDLAPGGPDGKYSYSYSREFSRAKKHKIGISDKTTYHSFRHNTRTQLTDVDADVLREQWIDAILGHESGGTLSEGSRTYLKRIGIQRLQQVVEAIVPPIDLTAFMEGWGMD